jgi:hypothetical protein
MRLITPFFRPTYDTFSPLTIMAPNGGFGFKVKKRRPRGTKWQFA